MAVLNNVVRTRGNLAFVGLLHSAFWLRIWKFYPHQIPVKHQLTKINMEKRVAMCLWFLEKIDDDEEFLNDV